MNNDVFRKRIVTVAIAALGVTALYVGTAAAQQNEKIISVPGKSDVLLFPLVTSAGATECLPNARGRVTVVPLGGVELMQVAISGLPAETEFDLFVIQVPNAPFGLSWYRGDLETNGKGRSKQAFLGRFNEETFTVAPNTAPAPLVHDNAFPDADSNPATGPVHQFHLGLWFNSPEDAAAAGCSDAVTPFNGEHNAGIQVLNTSNFADDQGPLRQLKP